VNAHWRLTGEIGAAIGTGAWRGDVMTWSAGLGFDLLRRPLSVGVEARYRRLVDLDVRGIELGVRLAIPLRRSTRSGSVAPVQPVTPAEPPTLDMASDSVTDSRVLTLVSIARGAMGTPYLWGGSDANGFDCSGLVQYAYARIGIALPRTSAGQARAGRPVDRDPEALEPGDVLTFGDGSTVTHVGFYVGDAWFIHSTSQGVRQSRLRPDDPDARWWLRRWIGVRRMM
jgi:cell wall-associated NlpC family hydrolase